LPRFQENEESGLRYLPKFSSLKTFKAAFEGNFIGSGLMLEPGISLSL
jgi:hypothetical protein